MHGAGWLRRFTSTSVMRHGHDLVSHRLPVNQVAGRWPRAGLLRAFDLCWAYHSMDATAMIMRVEPSDKLGVPGRKGGVRYSQHAQSGEAKRRTFLNLTRAALRLTCVTFAAFVDSLFHCRAQDRAI